MNIDEIEKYILDGKWENQYPQAIEYLLAEVKRLATRLRDAEDLLENCGYCRECMWDRDSIGDIANELTKPVWPEDNTPLCKSCMEDFKEMIK